MKAEELRARQAPLKDEYRKNPDAARITLRGSARTTAEITAHCDTLAGELRAGLHPATGGDGTSACSGDMLLQALAACAGVTLRAVATAMGIELRSASVHAEGDLDFRGTLGVDKAAPVGFERIRVRFELDTDASDAALEKLLTLTERYCVVYQTLRQPPVIEVLRTP